jgi:prevent-host-death family protein
VQTIGVSEFKSHALEIMSRVAESKEPVLITKRGEPLVQLTPATPANVESIPDRLAGSLSIHEDLVPPLGSEMWEACR